MGVNGRWLSDLAGTKRDFRIGGDLTVDGAATLGTALSLGNGGTGATSAAGARTSLGLGTAATQNTGTSGATVPLLSTANVWAANQQFSGQLYGISGSLPAFAFTASTSSGMRRDAGGDVIFQRGSTGARVELLSGNVVNIADSLTIGGVALGTAAFKDIGTSGATVPLLSTANTWGADQTFSSVDINGGTIDSAVIGGATPAAASVTTLSASGDTTLSGQLTVTGNVGRTIRLETSVGNGNDAELWFEKARGGATPSIITSGDNLGTIRWYGYDGSAYVESAFIQVVSTAAKGGDVGGEMRISVNAANAIVIDESSNVNFDSGTLFVDAANNRVGVGTTSPGEKLDVAGNIAADTAFLVNNVHALTAVTTAGQTRTLDLSNGMVQTISANQNFTLSFAGPSGKAGFVCLYVYNPSGSSVSMSTGANYLASATAYTTAAGQTEPQFFFWDGGRAIKIDTILGGAGDLRPT